MHSASGSSAHCIALVLRSKDAVWFAALAGLIIGLVLALAGVLLRRITDPAIRSVGMILLLASIAILATALVVDAMHLGRALSCAMGCR